MLIAMHYKQVVLYPVLGQVAPQDSLVADRYLLTVIQFLLLWPYKYIPYCLFTSEKIFI
jgi:hypothetical protein